MKLIIFAVFLFSLSHSSAQPTLGSLSAGAVATPELHKKLKEELQQWTLGVSRPNRKLLQAGSQNEELLQAVLNSDYPGVGRLLREGADPNNVNENGFDLVAVAIINDKGSIVTLLINSGANIKGVPGSKTSRFGPLQFAAIRDAPDAAAALLAAGVPIDGLSSFGFSALHASASYGTVRLAEFLLDNGAAIDLHANTDDRPRALHIATAKKHLSMVKLFLSRGAAVNSQTETHGETPLHDAAQADAALIIQELLDNGADIDATDYEGRTPLWDAAFRGNENAMEVLVMNGANKSIKAYDQTPREALCACQNLDELPSLCQSKECESPFRMELLLAD